MNVCVVVVRLVLVTKLIVVVKIFLVIRLIVVIQVDLVVRLILSFRHNYSLGKRYLGRQDKQVVSKVIR